LIEFVAPRPAGRPRPFVVLPSALPRTVDQRTVRAGVARWTGRTALVPSEYCCHAWGPSTRVWLLESGSDRPRPSQHIANQLCGRV